MTEQELKEDIERLLREVRETSDVVDGLSECLQTYSSISLACPHMKKAAECLELALGFINHKYEL